MQIDTEINEIDTAKLTFASWSDIPQSRPASQLDSFLRVRLLNCSLTSLIFPTARIDA